MEAIQTASGNTDFKKTILGVDDEDITLKLWSKMLQKLGHTVLQDRYGYEALKIFEKNKNTISLVTLDMRMPGIAPPCFRF
jgi:CheY-like chemotaxis protein